ncbi:hypothetical protein SK128_020162 [Halocaridina rubra]|uniref:Uncharacterized protein n=1 Tax=Halocaridina rubra TaxID=373956 RepID=A0AAN9A2M5_HALRR
MEINVCSGIPPSGISRGWPSSPLLQPLWSSGLDCVALTRTHSFDTRQFSPEFKHLITNKQVFRPLPHPVLPWLPQIARVILSCFSTA